MHQKTIRRSCEIQGIGLHTGKEARIRILPAPPNHGVVFRVGGRFGSVDIPARSEFVASTRLSTCLGMRGRRVYTVEHLMAAVFGLELDNILIEVDGNEVPVMDGSSIAFVEHLREAGFTIQSEPKRYIRVLKPITILGDDRSAALLPSPVPLFSFEIDFPHPAINVQTKRLHLTPRAFVNELARARTFGFEQDLEKLQKARLARGVSLDNCVGLGRDGHVMNPGGLRYADEFVRHKMLDAVGDLSLAGFPIIAEYRGVKSGHAINRKLVRALLESADGWEWTEPASIEQAEAV
jgi:UDP-3-O-[3-hydroxymyristoyl] N-acetylglucosamine deacetylase